MLRANVEDGFVLVISQLEVLLRAMEVFFQHGYVVVLECVVERKVAVVVDDVGSRADLVNDRQLLLHANDVLDRLSLVVLHAAGLEELVVAAEPVENVLVAVPRALKQWVLSQVVTLLESLILVLGEQFKHLQILHLSRQGNRIMALIVRSQTFVSV